MNARRTTPRWVRSIETDSAPASPTTPVVALNILREVAGLEPWPEQSNEPR